jgi:hypothetical protein
MRFLTRYHDAVRPAWYAAIAVVAVLSVGVGAATILPVGSFHGAGAVVRAAGVLVGIAAGALTLRTTPLQHVARLAVVLATTSLAAALPLQLDQAGRLLQTYSSLSPDRSAASGGYQVPSAPGEAASGAFDRLRRIIPADETYVLYSDQGYALWVHSWLLPRVAVVRPAAAHWAIFQGKPHPVAGVRLGSLRRLGPETWIARVLR